MKEIIIKEKQQYLIDNRIFTKILNVNDKKHCTHCNSTISVGDYKVIRDEDNNDYICCPNYPKCNGTIIDWFDIKK